MDLQFFQREKRTQGGHPAPPVLQNTSWEIPQVLLHGCCRAQPLVIRLRWRMGAKPTATSVKILVGSISACCSNRAENSHLQNWAGGPHLARVLNVQFYLIWIPSQQAELTMESVLQPDLPGKQIHSPAQLLNVASNHAQQKAWPVNPGKHRDHPTALFLEGAKTVVLPNY